MSRAAGRRDQLVTIQQPSAARDGLGQRVETWSAVPGASNLWAEVQPIRGREFFAAGAEQSETTVRFVIDYLPGITDTMRVLWNGTAHALVGEPINVAGGGHTLELMCAAGVRDGQ